MTSTSARGLKYRLQLLEARPAKALAAEGHAGDDDELAEMLLAAERHDGAPRHVCEPGLGIHVKAVGHERNG